MSQLNRLNCIEYPFLLSISAKSDLIFVPDIILLVLILPPAAQAKRLTSAITIVGTENLNRKQSRIQKPIHPILHIRFSSVLHAVRVTGKRDMETMIFTVNQINRLIEMCSILFSSLECTAKWVHEWTLEKKNVLKTKMVYRWQLLPFYIFSLVVGCDKRTLAPPPATWHSLRMIFAK